MGEGGKDWEFGISRCKLLYTGWINNKILLHSAWNYIQYLIISYHQLLIAKFRLKLKKVGETTRPFGYDISQIPYDYTVEVMNRFKGLDLVDRMHKNYGQRFVILCRRQ